MRGNILAQARSEIYAREYAKHRGNPLNLWLENPIQHKREGYLNTRAVVDRYLREGVYTPPEGYEVAADEPGRKRA